MTLRKRPGGEESCETKTCFVELQTVGVSVEELAVDGDGESLVALLSLAVPQDVGAVAVAVHLHQHDDSPTDPPRCA